MTMQPIATRRCGWAFVTALSALLCTARAYGQDSDAAAGTLLFQQACSTCHGSDGRGQSRSQVGFDLPLPDFTDCDFSSREQEVDWTAIIHEGGPIRGFNRIMPAFGDALTNEQITQLVHHLQSFCADKSWPRGDLNLPRAFFTEKAYPEDEAVITTTIVTDGPDHFEQQYLWEQRFGSHSQMEVSLPLIRADLGSPDGWRTGIGDLAIAVKHVLRHSLQKGSILTVGGEVAFATGDDTHGFGNGTNIIEPYVAYGKILPRDTFLQLFANVEMPTDSSLNNEAGIRAAYGKTFISNAPFGRQWTPMVEALGAREMTGGADIEWDVVPQMQVTLSARQHIIASFGARVPVTEKAGRDTQYLFYLLWDWFDGGPAEGW
jgi:mono/diheme cytochrome c family protein